MLGVLSALLAFSRKVIAPPEVAEGEGGEKRREEEGRVSAASRTAVQTLTALLRGGS